MKKQIGLWLRLSTDDQAKGDSPKHHEHRARLFAQAKDWEIIDTYNLGGVSGKAVLHHPETKRMLADIANGKITGLIFSKLARLGRNTKELLELADYFKKHNADLISLGDSIDTSTPAGRFFYTILAAFGEMEREEIVDRVKKSIPARASMGKSLGGDAPYGYKWVDKQLLLDDKEAPIRKMMFELFLVHKRKMKVVTILNEKGYRTRKGDPFNNAMIRRCLEDPIAKGLRRMNYNTSSSDRKTGSRFKPESEWLFGEAPAIVSEELWEQCNKIIETQRGSVEKVRRPNVHLFSGVIYCHCGSKMYMRSNSPRYVCKDYKNCKNQIMPDDLEFIYQEQLKDLLFSETSLQKHIGEEKERLIALEQELKGHKQRIGELTEKIQKLLDLYYEGKVKKEDFDSYHDPLVLELNQRQASYNEAQAKVDVLNMDSLNNDYVLQEAKDLYSQWSVFTPEEKKTIIGAITKSITIGKEEIDIQLSAIPTLYKRPITDSGVASIQMLTLPPDPSSKLVQLMNDPLRGVH